MYKRVINNIALYDFIRKIPIVKKFFVFNVLQLEKVQSTSLFDNIVSTISNSNGTAKTSYENRFADLDEILLNFIPSGPVTIHDTAVSTGITSLELFSKFKEENEVTMNISDKYSYLYTKVFNTKQVFFDTNKELVFAYENGKLYSSQLTQVFKKSIEGFEGLTGINYENSAIKIWLLNPKVLKAMNENIIQFIEYDLFSSELSDQFDVVRSMNILNTVYFKETELMIALDNIYNSLKTNGIFLVGRTGLDNINRATFYKKSNVGFTSFYKVNNGSEIEYLIDQYNNSKIINS